MGTFFDTNDNPAGVAAFSLAESRTGNSANIATEGSAEDAPIPLGDLRRVCWWQCEGAHLFHMDDLPSL